MILDIEKFIRSEQPAWRELETMLDRIEKVPGKTLSLDEIRRLHYLYQRASAGLAQVKTFAAVPQVADYLEALVAAAYAVVHAHRRTPRLPRLRRWFFADFPAAVRAHRSALAVSTLAVTLGAVLGALLLLLDPEAKNVLLPPWLRNETPRERVAREQRTLRRRDPLAGRKTSFAAHLFTNNVHVSFLVAGLGTTLGIGSLLVLFSNGLMLGSVMAQYAAGGETVFMFGWLLPHGAVEIPAVLLAGQAGLVLAAAIIGRDDRRPLYHRLRAVARDFLTLLGGVAVLLCWAALIEAFFSQYPEPILPYWLKIAVGVTELFGLALFLTLAGRKQENLE